MIKSMTGYGKAMLTKEKREYQVEIKSVNHRYLDISIKMPRVLSYLEEEVKKQIAKTIKRGKVDVFISFQNNGEEGKEIKINGEIAKIYIEEFKKLAKQENLLSNIEVTEIAKLPDVLSIQNTRRRRRNKTWIIRSSRRSNRQISRNENHRRK